VRRRRSRSAWPSCCGVGTARSPPRPRSCKPAARDLVRSSR
jgi:hypothetical protein